MSDPSTAIGAHLAGWAYPASMQELISISAQIGDPKQSKKVMPWAMPAPGKKKSDVTEDEVAIANAELEESFVFAS